MKYPVSVVDGIIKVHTDKKELHYITVEDHPIDVTTLMSIEYYTPKIIGELSVNYRGHTIPAYFMATGNEPDAHTHICAKLAFVSKSGEERLFFVSLAECYIRNENPLTIKIVVGKNLTENYADTIKPLFFQRLVSLSEPSQDMLRDIAKAEIVISEI